jgi:hypothetical protein
MTTDALRCRCGREVAIARLSRERLILGHTTNPGPDHHPVRLRPALASAGSPRTPTRTDARFMPVDSPEKAR